ncbi:DUF6207 family protein [Streptomyces sp. NPDC003027]
MRLPGRGEPQAPVAVELGLEHEPAGQTPGSGRVSRAWASIGSTGGRSTRSWIPTGSRAARGARLPGCGVAARPVLSADAAAPPCLRPGPSPRDRHIAEPGLVVLDVTAADEDTVRAVMDALQQQWATSGSTPVRRRPGEGGIKARVYADVHRSPPGTND